MTEKIKYTKFKALTKADEFLQAISPIGPYLTEDFPQPSRWIFRGEKTMFSKPLVPSAFRPDQRQRLINLSRIGGENLPDDVPESAHIAAEFLLLQRYYEAADRAGLSLPEDTQELRFFLQDPSRSIDMLKEIWRGETFPPDNLLSLTALAQHYGLPTRLLDWTRNHLIAAYFAAKGALEAEKGTPHSAPLNSNKSLVVWALNEAKIYTAQRAYAQGKRLPLVIISAPAAINPNLHAQEALFTLWRPLKQKFNASLDRSSLHIQLANDATLKQKLENESVLKKQWGNAVIFYRFELPHSEACKLFKQILKLGVTAGKLYPGYQGAAEALRDASLADP